MKSKICKKALKNIEHIYKNSKVKIIGIEDYILARSFINEAKSLFFIPEITYYYEFRKKGKKQISNIKDVMLKDKNNKLYLQQVLLKLTKNNKDFKKVLKSFKNHYEFDKFYPINKYFKEDFISFCIDLINKYDSIKKKSNNIDFNEEINLIYKKLNLMIFQNISLEYINDLDS